MTESFQSILKSRILFHVAGWIIFLIAPLLLSPAREFSTILSDPANLQSIVIRNVLLMVLFYFNLLYLTPVVLKSKGVGIFLMILIASVVVVGLLNWQVHHLLSDPFGPEFRRPPPPNFNFDPRGPRPIMLAGPLFSSFLIAAMVASISTSIVLWNDWVKTKVDEQERAFQKVASELAVLKLQISPHFLFNTLNNIRWLVRSKSDRAEEAIIKLSQLLRYILYQTDQEKIALEKEIENLKDYISLQQMRLSGHERLSLSFKGDPSGRQIVPLLFIPLVENVYKYGDFGETIVNQIHMAIEEGQLFFTTENLVLKSVMATDKTESGIGLSNVKKRLLLHYPDKHRLDYFEKEGIFKLKLQLFLD